MMERIKINKTIAKKQPEVLWVMVTHIGIATGMVEPAVFPKWVTWVQVQVQLPNLDTSHNCVPLPQYHGYKQVF